MARKSIVFTVEANNRDKGKQFKITEMPARKAEEWAIRLACAVIGAGVTVPDNMMMAIGAAVAPAPAEDNAEARELYESVMASGMAGLAQWVSLHWLKFRSHSQSLCLMSCLAA